MSAMLEASLLSRPEVREDRRPADPDRPPFTLLGTWQDTVVVSVSLDDGRLARPELLSAEELRSLVRIRCEVTRRRSLRARAALRLVLASCLDVAAERIALAKGPHGKPALALRHRHPLRFNLSHSGNRMLVALGESGEVGIDIESVDRSLDVEAVAGQALAADELASLPTAPDARRAALLRLWTRKEAMLKATGTGLMRDPRTITLPPTLRGPRADGVLDVDGERWRLVSLPVGDLSLAALAVALP